MDLITLAYVGSLITAATSVGSMVAVAWQLRSLSRQTREAARQAEATAEATRAAVYLSTNQIMISIDQYLIDNPRIRAILYGQVADGGSGFDLQREAAAAEMMIDMMDLVTTTSRHLSEDLVGGWANYFRHLISRSPSIRRFWREHHSWYGEDTHKLLNECMQSELTGDQTIIKEMDPLARPRL